MKKLTFVLVLLFLLNACTRGPVTHPAPSVAQIGSDLNCTSGDHGFEDGQAGWGFCYPATWQYLERVANPIDAGPTHLDILLSFTKVTCLSGTPDPASPKPVCSPGTGAFGLVVVSTYDSGSATDLTSWIAANLKPVPTGQGQSIQWGDATQASQLADGRRIALTAHHVVILELRAAKDGLDLEAQLSTRLSTWKFLY
jgi:hypothetical protein